VLHLLLTALTVYTTLIVFRSSRAAVAFNCVFSFGYLMIGYWSHLSNQYSFEWTIAHCVLTLRLIGISFNAYDRNQIEGKEHEPNHKSNLNFSEFLGFCFFPSTVLIGPQFDFPRYQHFVRQFESHSAWTW
jgi:lysophospholipid acyltransferase 5